MSPTATRLAPPGHGRQDDQHVAVVDRGVEAVEDPYVLVVQVDVDVAVELAAVAEELALGGRMLVGERAQDLADVRAVGADLLRAARGRAQDRGNADSCHEVTGP